MHEVFCNQCMWVLIDIVGNKYTVGRTGYRHGQGNNIARRKIMLVIWH